MESYKPMLTAILDDTDYADILRLSGDLAWDTVNLMKDTTGVLAGREGRPLVVDLSGLEFIDSKGISFLLQLRFAFENKALYLISMQSNIRIVLERTFVLNRFSIYKDISEVEGIIAAEKLSA